MVGLKWPEFFNSNLGWLSFFKSVYRLFLDLIDFVRQIFFTKIKMYQNLQRRQTALDIPVLYMIWYKHYTIYVTVQDCVYMIDSNSDIFIWIILNLILLHDFKIRLLSHYVCIHLGWGTNFEIASKTNEYLNKSDHLILINYWLMNKCFNIIIRPEENIFNE